MNAQIFTSEYHFAVESVVAGLLASFACGLGALPLLLRGARVKLGIGLGYGFSGGMMFAASVYNLLLPAFTLGAENSSRLQPVLYTLGGMFLGCVFLWSVERFLTPERLESRWLRPLGGRVGALVFITMTLHSIPEGVAVGVGFGSEEHLGSVTDLGVYISVAIAIHNIPEGLAVAIPLHAQGASVSRCFWFAFFTSLPQPVAAVPASLLVSFFEPLMLPFLGFAAGAMMYLVIVELIPDALESQSRSQIAWAFMIGFGLMALVQVAL
jgi:zinc transporter ZupT